MLYHSPQVYGLARSRWWLAGLGTVIEWLNDRPVATIWRVLRRLGFAYRRARDHVHSPDPAYAAKLAAIAQAQQLVVAQPRQYACLYQDEMTYYRRPSLAQAYAVRGSKKPLAHGGWTRNAKRRVAGALDTLSGRLVSSQRSRFDRWALLAFYRQLERAYPDAHRIFLVQDNWPVHAHPDVQRWLATSRITVLPLPTYAPWTNPIEKVWRRLKQEVLHLHPWQDDWPGLQSAVQSWLDQWQVGSVDLLRYVGLFPY